MKLHSFIVMLGSVVILISFITALYYAKKSKPAYFKYIFAFIVFGALLSVNTIASNNYAWLKGMMRRILFEQILILFQSIALAFFFLKILCSSNFIKPIKWFLIVSLLIQIGVILIVQIYNIEIRPTTSTNLFLLLFCFFYLKDLMNNKPTVVLAKSSSFWLVMGIFISSSIGFPVSAMIPYISKSDYYYDLRLQIFSIYNISLIILYLFIIKSYICLKHPQTS